MKGFWVFNTHRSPWEINKGKGIRLCGVEEKEKIMNDEHGDKQIEKERK